MFMLDTDTCINLINEGHQTPRAKFETNALASLALASDRLQGENRG